jgi:hypothetical protein
MASLSSLFGVGTQQQQQPQAAAVTTQELPKQIAPYYEKLLKEAEALYKQKMEAGAPIYEGKTIAGYTPEQEQLFSGLQSLQGTQAPKFAEAEALTRGTAARVTPDEVQEYMNPYQQAVVDIEKREAEKQYQSNVVPQLAAQAAAAGSFGGSRQGILEGMASEANQRLQADIQAKGSAQAYQDAMSNINQQRQREGAAAGQLAQLAPAGFSAQAQELGAIGKVGDVKQQQSQLALDEAYKQYIQEQQFPSESLKEYQSYVQSFPNIATQITRTPPPQQPGLSQQLLGLGTAAVGTYGAFGGFSPGGFMGMKQAETGGGISGLPVVRAQKSAYLEEKLQKFEQGKVDYVNKLKQLQIDKQKRGFNLDLENLAANKKTQLDRFKTKVEDFQTGASEAYDKPFNELSKEEINNYRKVMSQDSSGLASIVPDNAGAGEFGSGEYTGLTKEELGLGTDTTQSTSDQNNQSGLADIESNISNVPTEEEYQARLQQQQGAPPPSTTVETPSTIDAQVKALMGTSTAAADARANLDTLFSKQLGEYEMSKDVGEGFEKVRGGTETDIADVETDITESKQATKNELFTPLIDLGAAIASGKTTISAALTEAAKNAVGIQVKGKARTRALKKEKRKLEKELDRFDLDLAQYTEEKVTKREQDIFNRAAKKHAMGLEINKLEEKITDRRINAWKAVTSNINAERNAESTRISVLAQKTAAENPKTKIGYDSPGGKDLEVATNYVTGAVKVLKNDDKLLNNISGILSKSFGRDVTSNDTKATLNKIIQDPLFINNYEEYHQANVKANKDTTPIRREDTLNAFLPFYLQGRKDLFTRDRAYIPLDKTLGIK